MNVLLANIFILAIIQLAIHSSAFDWPPLAVTKSGILTGTTGTNLDGDKYYKFLGVPYAEPPRRFKSTTLKKPWLGIRNATQYGNKCLGRGLFQPGQISGSEDCLFLNVFTRNLPSIGNNLKPVMVFIFGGAFVLGSSNEYSADYLMSEDIVLVTINYRLGILGFLSLNDLRLGVPGNAGLKDQNLALQWVQHNIAAFNGDKDRVTIFGEAAGAASVDFHLLSPASKGLFHGAIMESGSALIPWTWGDRNAIEVVNRIGAGVDNERDALDVLNSLSGEELILAQERMVESLFPNFRRSFGPVVELPHSGAFLSEYPLNILQKGKFNQVPVVMGFNSKEGTANIVATVIIQLYADPQSPEFTWDYMIPWQAGVVRGTQLSKNITDILEATYTSESDEENEINVATDSEFGVAIATNAKYHLQNNKNPVFMYRASLNSSLNVMKAALNDLDQPGTFHMDELGYLFNFTTNRIVLGSFEDTSIRRFVKLWTNFAKFYNPTPNNELGVLWEPLQQAAPLRVLDINVNLEMIDSPETERLEAWSQILEIAPYIEN